MGEIQKLCSTLISEPCNERQNHQNWQTMREAICKIADALEDTDSHLRLEEGRLIELTDSETDGPTTVEVRFCDGNLEPQHLDMVRYNAENDCWAKADFNDPDPITPGCGIILVGGAVTFDAAAVAGKGLDAVGDCQLEVDISDIDVFCNPV